MFFLLELGVVGSTGERYHIANVCHSCHKEQQALESESESRVGARTVTTGIEIPPHILHRNTKLLDTCEQFIVVGLALRATYYLTNLGEEHIHRTNSHPNF